MSTASSRPGPSARGRSPRRSWARCRRSSASCAYRRIVGRSTCLLEQFYSEWNRHPLTHPRERLGSPPPTLRTPPPLRGEGGGGGGASPPSGGEGRVRGSL